MKFAFNRDEVREVAAPLFSLLDIHKIRHEIVGSYRRGKDTIGDLDILVSNGRATLQTFAMDTRVRIPEQPAAVKHFKAFLGNLQIDIYETKADGWGASQIIYTGNIHFVRSLRAHAKRLGMRLKPEGVFDSGGWLTGETEIQVFYVLGLEYVAPEKRVSFAYTGKARNYFKGVSYEKITEGTKGVKRY